MYEYGTLKPVEAILRRQQEEEGEQWRNQTKVGYVMCIYENVIMNPLVQL
jgi:hypothetical protein